MTTGVDVAVIGGGQAGLAAGYYLRRTGLTYVILDAQGEPGGAWRRAWESLRLFSPACFSSLPGRMMPGSDRDAPGRDAVVDYLADYEHRYDLPVEHGVAVERVVDAGDTLAVEAGARRWTARAVISATGTSAPRVPALPGVERFAGVQLHSAEYRSPAQLAGKRVAIVGGGNSGAQLLAELSLESDAVWMTERPPRFMADDVDGRVLFDAATRARAARANGDQAAATAGVGGLGDIVMVPSVKAARDRGALTATGAPVAVDEHELVRADGTRERADAIVWCTGFGPATAHLADLEVLDDDGRVAVEGTRAVEEPRLWMLGYGDWTGFASATLIGVGRTARGTVEQIAAELGGAPLRARRAA